MNKVVMGSVYMDKGEGLEYLEKQIMRMAAEAPEYYFIDFICTEDQTSEAVELLGKFYKMVGEHLPNITGNRIFAAITCEEEIRPAAMALALTTGKNDYKFKDVNPGRTR